MFVNAMRKGLIAATMAAGMLAVGTAAQAVTLNFDASSDSSNPTHTGASGTAVFGFADEGDDVRVTIDISNTTGTTTFGAGATASMLTGFGFDLLSGDSYVSGSFGSDGALTALLEDASANPFDDLDIAFADNNNFNGGNANGALPAGEMTVVNFLLSSVRDAVAMADAYQSAFFETSPALQANMRFQQVNAGAGSDKLLFQPSVSSVPLPAGLSLMLTVFAAFGLIALRRPHTA